MVWWENAGRPFLPSPPCVISVPGSKTRCWCSSECFPLSWMWENGPSKLGGVGMIFSTLLFCGRHIIPTSWVDWPSQWVICSGIWLASSASVSQGYLPICMVSQQFWRCFADVGWHRCSFQSWSELCLCWSCHYSTLAAWSYVANE